MTGTTKLRQSWQGSMGSQTCAPWHATPVEIFVPRPTTSCDLDHFQGRCVAFSPSHAETQSFGLNSACMPAKNVLQYHDSLRMAKGPLYRISSAFRREARQFCCLLVLRGTSRCSDRCHTRRGQHCGNHFQGRCARSNSILMAATAYSCFDMQLEPEFDAPVVYCIIANSAR